MKNGEKYINKIYPKLHNMSFVMYSALPSDLKEEKLEKYFERLKKIEKYLYSERPEYFKKIFYDKYIIKAENVPESYFELQKKLAKEQGKGDIRINDEQRKEMIEIIIEDQKSSLDNWLEYFISDETNYPEWFKYYAFQGMISLGSFDKKKQKFNERKSTTTNIFVDLNREAISLLYDELIKYLNNEQINDNMLECLIANGNFGKIYSYILSFLEMNLKYISNDTDGIWRKFEQNSVPNILVDTIIGRGTGWCTAGLATATVQLQSGAFYIFFTKSEKGEYSQPRIAIRMEGNSINEIRGIDANQNLESGMDEILDEKLKEFPDRYIFSKKVNDMKKLTDLYNKYKEEGLTKENLLFLYEVNSKIEGFGYRKDPRIKEILSERNKRKDLAYILNCLETEIVLSEEEFDSEKNVVSACCNLDLSGLTTEEGLRLPKGMNGNLYLSGLTTAVGLELPKIINGNLYLSGLTTALGLRLPETMNGNLDLSGLTTAVGLELPKIINGGLGLSRLTTAVGLELPEIISGHLYLSGLTTALGLKLPKVINGHLYLSELTTAVGLRLPETMNGGLDLSGLTTAVGLEFPETMNGPINLTGLTTIKGLNIPDTIDGDQIDMPPLLKEEYLAQDRNKIR